jgi:arginine decarboxylase
MLDAGNLDRLAYAVRRVTRALASGAYRRRSIPFDHPEADEDENEDEALLSPEARALSKPYFEVLIVDRLNEHQERWLKASIHAMRRPEDPFHYEPVVVPSLEDALIGCLFNHNVQAVVVRPGLALKSANALDILARYLDRVGDEDVDALNPEDYGPELCRLIAKVRPELDAYLITDRSVEEIAGRDLGLCRRVFYNQEDFMELHLNILRGVQARNRTPFFTALKEYSRQPTGVFHAMPISRGKSITRSHWIQDMGAFYGANIFMAETSATSGGLDSLLEPHGPIKEAQELAARAFGSKQTYLRHQRHLDLQQDRRAGAGAAGRHRADRPRLPQVAPLRAGAGRRAGRLSRELSAARLFDVRRGAARGDQDPAPAAARGGAARPGAHGAADELHLRRHRLQRRAGDGGMPRDQARPDLPLGRGVVRLRALRPDLPPAHRDERGQRPARTPALARASKAWEKQQAKLEGADDAALIKARLLPPPQARVRVYATQSTHKTLTALRQGSMIHVNDQDFKGEVEQSFREAYMTHTSTSPNYQIIASLDVGRRQVELEGFEFVQRQYEAAMSMRRAIATHPLLQKYFKVLTAGDMIPEGFRESGITSYFDSDQGWTDIWESWARDEFVLDPTRITVTVGSTGYDGDTFKTEILMDATASRSTRPRATPCCS